MYGGCEDCKAIVKLLRIFGVGGFGSDRMLYRNVAELSSRKWNFRKHLSFANLSARREISAAGSLDGKATNLCACDAVSSEGTAKHDDIECNSLRCAIVETCSPSFAIPAYVGSRIKRLLGLPQFREFHGRQLAASASSTPVQVACDIVRLDSGDKLATSVSGVETHHGTRNSEFSLRTDDLCYNCTISRFQPDKGGDHSCPADVPMGLSSIISQGMIAMGAGGSGEADDPTTKLKQEFEAARKCFEHIPSALQGLPKMNPNGVYANHNLRLDRIGVYGFDYDYTLAHYTQNLQPLIYDLAKKHLVQEYKYPASCLKFEYDAGFPIRGLYYDKKKGFLLKLDFFHYVEPSGCFFGRRRMTRTEIEEAYGGKHISIEHMPNLVPLMDLFCLSEVCLISDVIQHFVDQGMEFDSAYVYEDVKRSINFVHRSGLMHGEILRDPATYLVKNTAVVEMLKGLKRRGKKLFILTNSPFPFVDGGMRFLFQEDGRDGETWRSLFDVVIALADKPNFYTSERPFRYYNSSNDILTFKRVEHFQPHSVYYHGCLRNFLEITKWRGPEVLYFGDHLYSDLRGPVKAGWRTAAIIRELEREIETQNKNEYRFQQAKYHIVQELLGKYHGLHNQGVSIAGESALLTALRHERQVSRLAMKAMFNPSFGSTFLTDTGKESSFSYNVQRYADVYTSRLENLMTYSTEAWLYTPFDVKILPHHIKVGPSRFLKGLAQVPERAA